MKKIIQFVKFGVVGLSNTVISYLIYLIMVLFHFHYLLASSLGFGVSVLNSYFWNNKYVFKADENEKRVWWMVLAKTFISYAATGLILSNVLLVLWIEIFQFNEIIAPMINLIITIPLNFILNKLWAYKNK